MLLQCGRHAAEPAPLRARGAQRKAPQAPAEGGAGQHVGPTVAEERPPRRDTTSAPEDATPQDTAFCQKEPVREAHPRPVIGPLKLVAAPLAAALNQSSEARPGGAPRSVRAHVPRIRKCGRSACGQWPERAQSPRHVVSGPRAGVEAQGCGHVPLLPGAE